APPGRPARPQRHGIARQVAVRARQPRRRARGGRRRFRDPLPPRAQALQMNREHLIIDADDTLWENNIYFERAFDAFVDYLDHSSLTRLQVRDVLDDIETVNARIHGYGSANFGRNLQQCFERLAERDARDDDL